MLSKSIFFISATLILIINDISEPIGLCPGNDTSQGQSLLLITFGSGLYEWSNKTPIDFNFNTSHQQVFTPSTKSGQFGFVNVVPNPYGLWHGGQLDHTPNDIDGYMYIIDVNNKDDMIFHSIVNNLCIGTRYEFSAYLSNFEKPPGKTKPNVRFEVRAATDQNDLLSNFSTGDIAVYNNMSWDKYGLSFNASTPSIVLLIISNVGPVVGNDLSIDDIELRVCSFTPFVSCPPDETTTAKETPTTAQNMIVHSTNVLSTFDSRIQVSTVLNGKAICNPDCKNNGTCTEQNTCICPNGFIGPLCDIQSVGLCSNNDTTNDKSLLLITFGSGSEQYSTKTPASFNFTTTHQQQFTGKTKYGMFIFVNAVPDSLGNWHTGALDHTPNDGDDGYMYIVDVAKNHSLLFNSTINDLCIGLRYEFSAYLANVVKKKSVYSEPNVRFQIGDATIRDRLIAHFSTGNISEYDNMTWLKHGLSFVATSRSVFLSIISNANEDSGNDLAIDDIELRVCSTMHSGFYPPNCSSPMITLVPNAPFMLKPVQFRRNQDFYISSKFQISCALQPLSITYNWTILTCSSTCSSQVQLANLIDTTKNELFIRSQILPHGVYELKLIVSTISVSSTSSIYIEISNSNIITNLVSIGQFMIKHNSARVLILDPGKYSLDLNKITFNPTKWNYTYYCRVYHYDNSINQEELKEFDDSNENCFSNKSSINLNAWEYNDLKRSSVKIFSGSLKSNQTYQFMVHMINQENSSIGYLFVEVENISSQMIIIDCVTSTMCLSNRELKYINSNTQLALVSFCSDACSSLVNITWNIFQGLINSSNETVQWIPFNQIMLYKDCCTFGLNTKNLTITKNVFLENTQIIYWRFEVIYSFEFETKMNAISIEINKQPQNGTCSIDPLNGTLNTLFTINCTNWYDQDYIKDYTFYGWTKNPSKQLMLGFTTESIFQLRLPASIDETMLLHLVVQIRDTFNSITEFNLSSVIVLTNISEVEKLITYLQDSNNNDSIVELLVNGDQNTVGQLVTSISHVLNGINDQYMKTIMQNGKSTASVSVTPLNNLNMNFTSPYDSILSEFNEQLNRYANIREQLMMYINQMKVITPNDLKFQSSILSELTETTNQLTRKTSELASNKSLQLSQILKSLSTKISSEDVQSVATHLIESIANVMTGVNGVLQGRHNNLNLDLIRSHEEIIDDYANDCFFEQVNICHQKQTANQILNDMYEIISTITSALNLHLNINQTIHINTSSVYFSLEKTTSEYLSNRSIINQIYLPIFFNSSLQSNSIVLLRSMIEPLSFYDNFRIPSIMNFSRSISFSILDENETNIDVKTNFDNPIQIIIPRDENLFIEKMFLQNVTNLNNVLFNFHSVNLKEFQLNFSIHFEMHSLNKNLSYLLIYKFDLLTKLANLMNEIDGWTLFCSSNKDEVYSYSIDNHQTLNHYSIIFGIRELNQIETNQFCLNKTLKPLINDGICQFTSDYEIRTYLSGCFYLDSNNHWKSDGLLVGPLTNHFQTQCFSTHLTTFSSAFLLLPAPMNYSIVSNNLSVMTIFLYIISFVIFQKIKKYKTDPLIND